MFTTNLRILKGNSLVPPAPPLIIRQQPPRPITPQPLVIREAPPQVNKANCFKNELIFYAN